MLSTTSSLYPTNLRQLSVSDFTPANVESQGAMRLLWAIIELSAAFLVKNADNIIVAMSLKERQQSVNDF